MKILHLCWGLEPTNGAANIARMIMGEQREKVEKEGGDKSGGGEIALKSWLSIGEIRNADEIWVHCGWYYGIWWAVFWAKRFGKRVYWVPECCYDPIRLAYHGWKKRLVGPFERWALRRADVLVATCRAEGEWIRAYEPRVKKVEINDIRRFFKLGAPRFRSSSSGSLGEYTVSLRSDFANLGASSRGSGVDKQLQVLYLGRPHVLKGTKYLEQAVKELNDHSTTTTSSCNYILRMVSDHHGEELEKDWEWCDVLCLPTLSDNFGLVVAEALERGKRVITTDGAPAWEPPSAEVDSLIYLKGYRDGSEEMRVEMLKGALRECLDSQSV